MLSDSASGAKMGEYSQKKKELRREVKSRLLCYGMNVQQSLKVTKRYSLQLKRDAANTWEVDSAFKPPAVLFSNFSWKFST
ncbi:hypothetical protein CMV_023383 [Castanea mollissima]|uniref:Uncharacterized protein n=1 Tax=Castanea mollissima TaxID=60419 RepID=A0A8J4VDJ6_9ROSI|nr:hypothetical protein CMV_023383 [Castanea mollissima]